MKASMHSHVAVERDTMFQQSADTVRSRLQAMVKEIEGLMDDKAHEVFTYMKRDYRAVLGSGDASKEGEMLPRGQRRVRREIMHVIDGVDKIFKKVAGLPVEEDDEEEDDDQHDKTEGKEEEDSAHDSEGDNVARRRVKKATRDASIKREATPSDQLADEEEPPRLASSRKKRATFMDQLMEAAPSDHESEPKLQSPQVSERVPSLARTKSEGGDGDVEAAEAASNATESSDSD